MTTTFGGRRAGGCAGVRRSRGPLDRPIRSHRVAPAREGAGHVEQDEIERGPRPDREHHEDARDAEEPPTHRTAPRSPCPRARRRRRRGRRRQRARAPRAATRGTSLDTGTAAAPTAGRRSCTRPARRRARARRRSRGGTARRRGRPRRAAARSAARGVVAREPVRRRAGSRPERSSTRSTHATTRGAVASAIARGVGSKPASCVSWPKRREVGRAGAVAHDEARAGEARVEQREEPPVARPRSPARWSGSSRRRRAGRPAARRTLAGLRSRSRPAGRQDPARQDRRGVRDVGGERPAVVEHRLREPLVGVVLDRARRGTRRRVGRHDRAPGVRRSRAGG